MPEFLLIVAVFAVLALNIYTLQTTINNLQLLVRLGQNATEQRLILLDTVNNNTGSNRNMTIHNRMMIDFLRDKFDEQFIAELKQDQLLTEQKLDILLVRMMNGSDTILGMLNRTTAPRSSPE